MENKKILCSENIDLIGNESNKETKDKNDKIILPIKILINPSQIEESENNNYIKENKIKINNNNKDSKSRFDIKKPFSQNFSCNKSKNGLLGKKRKNKISNQTNNHKKTNSRKINAVKNAKIKNIDNSIELINNFPCSNHENKLNIPQDLSFRLCECCECEEKKENKKMDIVEKIRKSIDKSKNESSSKKINTLWINWINEVITSSNENEINENNNTSENKLYTSKSSTNHQLKSDKIFKINEDLKKNRDHNCISCIRNIAKIKTNNALFG